MTIIDQAVELVPRDSCVGLGSGRAAQAFVRALGQRVREHGLRVHAVPTSEQTAALARREGISLVTLEEAGVLDLCVDGADEVDPDLNLIKGYGRALVREKIVAASSRRFIVLVGTEKLVPQLGTRGRLPVEVLPFALPLCERRLRGLGCEPVPYRQGDRLFVTDNGNHIIDCLISPIPDAVQLEREIVAVPGVVGTGLFLGMASAVFVGAADSFQLIEERHHEGNGSAPVATPSIRDGENSGGGLPPQKTDLNSDPARRAK